MKSSEKNVYKVYNKEWWRGREEELVPSKTHEDENEMGKEEL